MCWDTQFLQAGLFISVGLGAPFSSPDTPKWFHMKSVVLSLFITFKLNLMHMHKDYLTSDIIAITVIVSSNHAGWSILCCVFLPCVVFVFCTCLLFCPPRYILSSRIGNNRLLWTKQSLVCLASPFWPPPPHTHTRTEILNKTAYPDQWQCKLYLYFLTLRTCWEDSWKNYCGWNQRISAIIHTVSLPRCLWTIKLYYSPH